ncbi:MAG: CinA family protein [Candidatus Thermoplasmatota archaeon]|nr:CinA family protein [Candidatus Thermoplasmatota archaeon]
MKNPVEQLSSHLASAGRTISLAESVTGGMLSAALTSMPGISSFFRGAVVAYSSIAKQEILGVSAKTIAAFGEVSHEVAEEMAAGVSNIMKTDTAIATTGLAGPGGDGSENPVGLCFMAVFVDGRTSVRRSIYSGGRDAVRQSCAADAILFCNEMLADILKVKRKPNGNP